MYDVSIFFLHLLVKEGRRRTMIVDRRKDQSKNQRERARGETYTLSEKHGLVVTPVQALTTLLPAPDPIMLFLQPTTKNNTKSLTCVGSDDDGAPHPTELLLFNGVSKRSTMETSYSRPNLLCKEAGRIMGRE